jgi:hypothetical protein
MTPAEISVRFDVPITGRAGASHAGAVGLRRGARTPNGAIFGHGLAWLHGMTVDTEYCARRKRLFWDRQRLQLVGCHRNS